MLHGAAKDWLKQYKWIAGSYRTLRQTLRTTQVQVRNVALDAGLLPGHTGYTRFVIISRGRSGTSLLRSLLNDHAQVVTFGEIFRKFGAIGWDRRDYQTTEAQLAMIETAPVAFLETYLFRKFPKRVTAVGFKLFYYHARNPEWEPVWQYLQDRPEIKIIHLKRQNILATHLSLRRAFLTNKWSNGSGRQEEAPRLTLTYAECREAFEKTREWEVLIDTTFTGPRKLDMRYEALSRDREAEMKRVQAFLGLDYQPMQPHLHKQNRQTLAESIVNYEELKDKFSGTPWEQFFVD